MKNKRIKFFLYWVNFLKYGQIYNLGSYNYLWCSMKSDHQMIFFRKMIELGAPY